MHVSDLVLMLLVASVKLVGKSFEVEMMVLEVVVEVVLVMEMVWVEVEM